MTHPPLTVNLTRPQDAAKVLPCHPLLSSVGKGWHHLGLQVYDPAHAWETPAHTSTHHLLEINLDHGTTLERHLGDQRKTEVVRAEDCALVPEGVEHRCAWPQARGRFMIIEMEHNLIAQLAWEAMDPDLTELKPTFLQPDPLIHSIGVALYNTLAPHGSYGISHSENYGASHRASQNGVYIETLTQTLALQLLRHYATHPLREEDPSAGLSSQQLKQVQDYIHNCLDQDIILSRIPILLGMSQYRFSRSFQQSMGLSPYQYIMQKRAERARILLNRSPQMSLTEVAMQSGFRDRAQLKKSLNHLAMASP